LLDRQDIASRQTQDVKILQKVNAHHRDAFATKYPGQVEHCLRLTMERLQAGLDKRDGTNPADPDTWRLSAGEIESLATTAHLLNSIRETFNEK
jgi:hypothetical protein